MSIYKYPDYVTFLKNERKTLEFIANQPYIEKSFSELKKSAELSYYNIPSNDRELKKSELNFGCSFDVKIEKKSRRIVIEALVRPNFSEVSYVLSICENEAAPFSLIRKFHFDYALPKKKEDRKPVYHLQYGGEVTPQLELLKIPVDALYPWLSTPRIRFYPVNLALLIDMIMCEFKSDETHGVVSRSEWCEFIKNNEDIILKPFYIEVGKFLTAGTHKSKFLLRDFYYGQEQ